MYRFFMVLALTGALVACTGEGDVDTDESPGSPVSSPVSRSPAATDDDTGGTGVTGTASADCSEAFSAIAEAEVSSITELGEMQDEMEATIEGCESVDDWIAGADEVIDDDINPNTADLLLRMNCDSPSLSNTPICEELASS